MLLTNEPSEKLDLARLLKKLFENDDLGNAFYFELSKTLTEIDATKIISDFTSFYQNNLITKESEIKK